jgi:hypothetical protein
MSVHSYAYYTPDSPYFHLQILRPAQQARDDKGRLMLHQTVVGLVSALTTIQALFRPCTPEGAQTKHLDYQSMPIAEEVSQTVDPVV